MKPQVIDGVRFGSVCSGIEAASVAWKPLGWTCAFMSEIDKAARRALAHHYPKVPLHGDFTTIGADDYGSIDVLVGGTPCQDFSIAGLRAGVAGERGNLTLEFLRLAERKKPCWIVWENVPGVLSIDGGRTFGTFLGGLAELGYGFAYRVLDAQYFGLAQRRERVFVVGYLGDWRPPAAVLFERESLLWDPAPSRKARKDVAPTLAARTRGGGGLGTDFDLDGGLIAAEVAGTLDTRSAAHMTGMKNEADFIVAAEVAPTLVANGNRTGGNRFPGTDGDTVTSLIVMSSGQANAEIREDGGATTLTCLHEAPIVAHAFKASHYTRGKDGAPAEIVPPLSADADKGDQDTLVLAHAFDARQSDVIQYGDMSGPLDTDGHTIGVLAFSGKDHGADAMDDLSPTLRAGGHHKSHANGGVAPAIAFSIMPMNSGKDYKARETDVAQPLMAAGPVGGNQGGDYIVEPVAFAIQAGAVRENPASGPDGVGVRSDGLAYTIEARAEVQAVAFTQNSRSEVREINGDGLIVGALAADAGAQQQNYVAFAMRGREEGNVPEVNGDGSVVAGLRAASGGSTRDMIACSSVVRRLTPTECERLQGFPDGWTQVPVGNKPTADGPRYKQLGNSMAVPVMAWIGRRIAMVERLAAEDAV